MSRRSSKRRSSQKTGFADWLRGQFEPSAGSLLDPRRLRFEYLEPRQMLSVAQSNGPEFQVNTYTTNSQAAPKVATDSAGDYVVVWQSYREVSNNGYGVFAQRYNVTGAPQGSEFRVSTDTNSRQAQPTVAMDSAGDFVVAWSNYGGDGSGVGVFAQRYNSSGVAQGSQFQVNTYTSSTQNAPAVAMDSAGDFVVTWSSYNQDGSLGGVYAQRYNASGTAQGSEFHVSTYTTSGQALPAVAMDSAGDFVITWESRTEDGSGYGIYAQRYNPSGIAQGSEFRVNSYTTGGQVLPSVAMDSVGDFVIAWESNEGVGYGIYALRYNSSGIAQGSEFQVSTNTIITQSGPAAAMNPAGDFVITWESSSSTDGDGVSGQRYNSSGVAQGGEFQVNTYTTGTQAFPAGAMDSAGDFVVAWQSGGQDGNQYGVYAQRYLVRQASSNTVVAGSEVHVSTYTTGNQQHPKVASDAAGDYVVIWQSYNQDLDGYGIYAQRYNSLGVTQGSEFRVNSFTTSVQNNPSVAMDSAGDFVVAWQSKYEDGSFYGIYAQRYNSSGVAQGSEFRANTSTPGNQQYPSVAMDSAGDFVIAWTEFNGVDGAYAQRYNKSGVAQGSEFRANTYTTRIRRTSRPTPRWPWIRPATLSSLGQATPKMATSLAFTPSGTMPAAWPREASSKSIRTRPALRPSRRWPWMQPAIS